MSLVLQAAVHVKPYVRSISESDKEVTLGGLFVEKLVNSLENITKSYDWNVFPVHVKDGI